MLSLNSSSPTTLLRATDPSIGSILNTAALALGAFAGSNIDSLLTLSGQLAATDRSRHRRIAEGQLTATVIVIGLCAVGGVGLQSVPHRLLGFLGLLPIAMGIRAGILALRGRLDDRTVPGGGGFLSSLGVTIAISGDNVAIYLPILATGSAGSGLLSILIWLMADIALIGLAGIVGRHPMIRATVARGGPIALPLVYVAVGIVVLFQAGTFA